MEPAPQPIVAGDPDAQSPAPAGAIAIVRLRKRWQFLAAAKGPSVARGAVAVQMLARQDGQAAIGAGFTATRKIGGAVVRNRAKRRLREVARQLLPLHGLACHDYVFIARNGAELREWPRLLDDVKSALIGLAAGGRDSRPARRSKPSSRPR